MSAEPTGNITLLPDASEGLAKLREPFPPSLIGHLPRGNTTLDYCGHGAVTSRLLDVDPEWNWEPLALDEEGLPLFVRDGDGNPVGFWIKLTVLGITRLGFGSTNAGQDDAEKVLIGDALRNAAMRFGVALDLWIKGGDAAEGGRSQKPRGQRKCVVCDKPLSGPAVPGGGGFAHPECVTPADDPNEEPF